MDRIRFVVRGAARRMGWDRTITVLSHALVILFGFTCLAILADKLLFLGMPIIYAVIAAACAAIVTTLVFAVRDWPSEREAAIEIDSRLRLAERISSSMAVARSDDAMARALVEDGRVYARSVPLVKTFPIKMRRSSWSALVLALIALAMLAWLPQWDVLARQKRMRIAQEEQEKVEEQAGRMRKEVQRLRKRTALNRDERIDAHLDEIEKLINEMEKGELTRAEAMAKLSDLAKTLKDEQQDLTEKAMAANPAMMKHDRTQARDMAEALAGNKFTEAKDLAKALSEKNPAEAAEAMKKLAEKMKSGELSREDMDKLAKEMSLLAKALGEEGAFCEACKDMASCLSEGDLDQLAKALAEAEFALDEMADMDEQLAMLSACAGMCKGAGMGMGGRLATWDGAGIYRDGNSRRYGRGMSGPGIGAGGIAPVAAHDVKFDPTKIKGQITKGRVVGSFFIDGKQVKGEARATYVKEVAAANVDAARALDKEQIPRAYQDYVRDYFESMREE